MLPIVERFHGIGFRFDVFAWYHATQRLDIDLDGVKNTDSETLFYTLLFSAHESYCRHSILKRNKFTFVNFCKRIDDMPYKSIKRLSALIKQATDTQATDTEVKKKHQNGLS